MECIKASIVVRKIFQTKSLSVQRNVITFDVYLQHHPFIILREKIILTIGKALNRKLHAIDLIKNDFLPKTHFQDTVRIPGDFNTCFWDINHKTVLFTNGRKICTKLIIKVFTNKSMQKLIKAFKYSSKCSASCCAVKNESGFIVTS